MHEMGVITGVLETVNRSAAEAGATRVLAVDLSIGRMTEIIEDVLQFAFDAVAEGTLSEGAELRIHMIEPRSRCTECGAEFEHDRFMRTCPTCQNPFTELVAGRELQIDSIEVDLPD